jgi:hypothetical protein
MEQSDKMGIKLSYKEFIDKAKASIMNSKKYAESQKKTIIDNINELSK